MNRIQYIVYLVASLLFASSIPLVTVSAEKCEDIAGTEKWDPQGHDDNNPSESKFDRWVFHEEDFKTTCEVAKGIDHMEIKGEIKEHEWDEFKDTGVYMATSEEVQDCFKDRFDLPDDDGEKHLADYEIQKCATGNY